MKRTSLSVTLFLLLIVVADSSVVCLQTRSLTILHTNDIHGHLLPETIRRRSPHHSGRLGGFSELSRLIDSVRSVNGAILLLDAGDIMTGTPLSDISYRGAEGGALFELMNRAGYDAWTIGNHDLDISQDNLIALTRIARFATLCANLTDSAGLFSLGNRPFVVVSRNGLRIGIIGLISSELFDLTNRTHLRGLAIHDPAAKAREIVRRIDGETDLIIALTHQGFREDSLLALSVPGLDIIVGGHSHTTLDPPRTVKGVVICQAGSYGEYLGVLHIEAGSDRVVSHHGELISLRMEHAAVVQQSSGLIDTLMRVIDRDYGEVIGRIRGGWYRSSHGESNIGHFIADAMREASGADIALTNSSGIRKDLPAGDVRKVDLYEVVPFRNRILTFTLSGVEVLSFARRYARSLERKRVPLQISGIEATYRNDGDSIEIVEVKVGGRPVDSARIYRCATTDFLVTQSVKYLGYVSLNALDTGTMMFEALVAGMAKDRMVSGRLEPRFRKIDDLR